MTSMSILVFMTVISAATPLLLAGTRRAGGRRRSGVLNLGVEGMMLVGAVAGFAVTATTGSAALGIAGGAVAGARAGAGLRVLTLTLLGQPGRDRPGAHDLRHRPLAR